MPVLTGIDVIGVQRFIFVSNQLRDVVSGSWLVDWSTAEDGALKMLEQHPVAKRYLPKNKLMVGGGNAILEFETENDAKGFVGHYTRLLYEKTPGLEVAVAHLPFQPNDLSKTLQALRVGLARRKTERIPSATMLGLSVTAPCNATRLPASGFDEKGPEGPDKPYARTIIERRNRIEEATAHWQSYIDKPECGGFTFPLILDQMGRTIGEKSLVGVVHVDGNSVGQKIKTWLDEKVNKSASDDEVRKEYGEWSRAIDRLGQSALKAAVDRVCAAEKTGRLKAIGIGRNKDTDTNQRFLPLRPILLGGDDITLVCDGRIALDLAATMLKTFEENGNIPHLGKLTASAGVAIAPAHAPFSRIYEISEKLCATAKAMLKDKQISGCAIDWHLGATRPSETMDDIRALQYTAIDGRCLTCRPYCMSDRIGGKINWEWFNNELLDGKEFGLRGKGWAESRNKAKSIASIARNGPEAMAQALKAWRVVNAKLKLPEPIEGNGFSGDRTPLLDAVELLDLHQSLSSAEDPL